MSRDHEEGADTATVRAASAPPPSPPTGQRKRASVDAASRARIGRELQRHYAQILALPIPDHLRALVDDLADQAEVAGSAERELSR